MPDVDSTAEVVVSAAELVVESAADVVVSLPDPPEPIAIEADTFELFAKMAFELFNPETTIVIVFPALELLSPLSDAAKMIVG